MILFMTNSSPKVKEGLSNKQTKWRRQHLCFDDDLNRIDFIWSIFIDWRFGWQPKKSIEFFNDFFFSSSFAHFHLFEWSFYWPLLWIFNAWLWLAEYNYDEGKWLCAHRWEFILRFGGLVPQRQQLIPFLLRRPIFF